MDITEEVEKFENVFWSGEEVSSKYLAEYYREMLDNFKQDNRLLGQFSGENYTFSDEIKKALIAVRKKIEDVNGNSYFIVSKTTKEVLTFKMRIFKVGDGNMLAANLYLIEVVDDPLFDKPLKTFIAQYVDKNTDEFVSKAKYIFNINIDGEFLELEKVENEKIIGEKFPKPSKISDEVLEILCKEFIEELILELEFCGPEGQKIAKVFKDEIKRQPEGKKISFVEMKKKIDALVEKSGGYKKLVDKNERVKILIENHNQKVQTARKEAEKIEISIERPKLDEKKEEKKEDKTQAKKPASKSASKSSGGKSGGGKSGGGKSGGKSGGGGKKGKSDKKKDDKKKGKIYPATFEIPVKPKKEQVEEKKPKVEEKKPVEKPQPPKQPVKDNKDLDDFDSYDFERVDDNLSEKEMFEEPKTQEPILGGKEEPKAPENILDLIDPKLKKKPVGEYEEIIIEHSEKQNEDFLTRS